MSHINIWKRIDRLSQRLQLTHDVAQLIDSDSKRKKEFITRFSKLTTAQDEFEELLQRYDEAYFEEHPEDHNTIDSKVSEESKKFENMFYPLLSLYEELRPAEVPIVTETNEKAHNSNPHSHVRLPKIELKIFGGALSEWPTFYNNFSSLIHRNESLDNVAKFHYLISSLNGPALTIATELDITSENYPIAWDNLVKRYQNTRLLASEILGKLLNYSPINKESKDQLSNFLTVFEEGIQSLQSLKIADLADFMLLFSALRVLPIGTKKAFERDFIDTKVPTIKQLLNFIREQSIIHEVAQISSQDVRNESKSDKARHPNKNIKSAFLVAPEKSKGCPCCNGPHLLFSCHKFRDLDISDRRASVQKWDLCFNCLRPGHRVQKCNNEKRCSICNAAHHSMLHVASTTLSPNAAPFNSASNWRQGNATQGKADPSVSLAAVARGANECTVVLGSALFQIQGPGGRFHSVRGVIDSAASTSFITTRCAKRIGLFYERVAHPVFGIGGLPSAHILGKATCYLKPLESDDPILSTETLVIENITSNLPCVHLPSTVRSHYANLPLADDKFDSPNVVEFLIGGHAFPFIYTGDKKVGPEGIPPALSSIFGWVITGRVSLGNSKAASRATALLSSTATTDSLLRKFWEVEEMPKIAHVHPDDVICEKIYKERHYRTVDGRYVVPLLLRENASHQLGDSQSLTLNRLSGIERRLNKDAVLKAGYEGFLDEYEKLGHMTEVLPNNSFKAANYIPHHCVVKDSTSTKYRVVFDGSQRTSSGISLNDIVYAGPKLQQNIFDIIFKFRTHQVVFTCDIRKMYRQILISPEDRKYQHIFWRQNGKIKDYELNTVTYGVASAPYAALRTINQLAHDEGHKYPLAAKVIREDIYVDDIATGCRNVQEAVQLQQQTISLLELGRFEVGKWASNRPELLSQIPPEDCVTSFDLTDENSILKLLGIRWDASSDSFFYYAQSTPHKITKRNILSQIAKIYDPLGWLSPVVFKAKIIMQQLWLQGVDWDSPVLPPLDTEWSKFCENLPSISSIKIDRCVTLDDANSHSLIGFCDASQSGYAATVYLRSETLSSVKVALLAAKSRVAPTKTISIPRLELCGAQLLSTLINHCKTLLNDKLSIENLFTFTDSEVVLAWLKTIPCQLKTFEANRVTFILENVEPTAWRHVASGDNPADVASRGCAPENLQNHDLWWTGPKWLTSPIDTWPNSYGNGSKYRTQIATGIKSSTTPPVLLAVNSEFADQFFAKYSNFSKLQRIAAWMLRFISNLRLAANKRIKTSTLSVTELNCGQSALAKLVQHKHFAADLQNLRNGREVSKNLKALQPFIDHQGLLRVGGRLRNANLPFKSTHPILLPKHDQFVNLLIDAFHQRYLHAGPRLLQSLLAREFWILSARSIIKSRLSKCLTCFRVKPVNSHPAMGDLPPSRVTPSKVFSEVGIDFGGPFTIREHKRRNPKLSKAYLCLFVCMATKAVHLEIVSDLSSAALLACFDRFISRRGLCHKIYSDNGTNFTGAKRQLSEVFDFLMANHDHIRTQLSSRKIEWIFIPPAAPHFGGLWEAGIKSAKYHLKRVVGEQTLTFEEITTIFSKIEAMMNSRPLCSLSTDVSEIDVLTPGHFLIGGPLISVPEYDLTETPINRLSRWQLLQQITQQFWRVWSRDYLHTQQQRNKWHENQTNLKTGTIVIVADNDTAPTHWKKGIIDAIHPGKDNVTRVVTVRTTTGTFKRPAVKVYPLPTQ